MSAPNDVTGKGNASSSDEQRIVLPDGRRLAYQTYGSADGAPSFFFHGWPGSRLDFAPNDRAAAAAGLHVVAVDRPGLGGSDPQPGRSVLDWPKDVAALADSFGFERFSVFGFSFGGPYARACAYALPERVTRTGLISCLGPSDDPDAKRGMPAATRYGLGAARISPILALPMVGLTASQALRGKMVEGLMRSMSFPDRDVLKRPDVRDALGRSLAESFRQGTRAATWDGVAVARGEGFRVEDLVTEVLIWHGERDRNDPVAMARLQEPRLRRAKAIYYPDDGHLIFYSRIHEILPELTTS